MSRHQRSSMLVWSMRFENGNSMIQRLTTHGLDLGMVERLTNIWYADDILPYTKSWQELVFMIECLVQQLETIGLHLNASKCRIIATVPIERPTYVNVRDHMLEVSTDDDFHKYLGRNISGDPKQRNHTELRHRFQAVWARFQKDRHVLTNKHPQR